MALWRISAGNQPVAVKAPGNPGAAKVAANQADETVTTLLHGEQGDISLTLAPMETRMLPL